MKTEFAIIAIILAVGALPAGCGTPSTGLATPMLGESNSPVERSRYAGGLTRSATLDDAEQLIRLMDDPDLVVRWRAWRSLKQVAARHGGGPDVVYNPSEPREKRLEKIAAWRQWLDGQRMPNGGETR